MPAEPIPVVSQFAYNVQKKQRFCWDEDLHYNFLKHIFCYGLERMIVRWDSQQTSPFLNYKPFFFPLKSIFQGKFYNNTLTYIIKMAAMMIMQEMQKSRDALCMEFQAYYRESLQYQDSYNRGEGALSRFSIYPFKPQLSDIPYNFSVFGKISSN